MKKLLLASLLASVISISPCFAAKFVAKSDVDLNAKAVPAIQSLVVLDEAGRNDIKDKAVKTVQALVVIDAADKALKKEPFKFESGDCTLTIGGKTKIENYFDRNISLLNRNIPDEHNYFKNTIDLLFDFAYGKKTFDHDAVKVFTKIRHKGVWGRGAVFADSDGMAPAPVKLSDSVFGAHSHTSGKPLLWINEAWLQFSINAIANASPERLHTVKMGWFPFDLGRGIALGSVYGLNREGFGLNTYVEDKGAPGILWHGELKKDVLSYDLYYAKFESRSKSLGDTLNNIKAPLLGRKFSPWRGSGKDNDLFAGRVKWKPFYNSKIGTLELEPYAFYNAASDQKIAIVADSSMRLGTFGMAAEHKYKSFEFGAEGAFNLGTQTVRGIDNNKIEIVRDKNATLQNFINPTPTPYPPNNANPNIGYIEEQFSHIQYAAAPYNNVPVTPQSNSAARQVVMSDSTPLLASLNLDGSGGLVPDAFRSKPGRILNEYVNKLRGFMVVVDVTQKIEDYKLDLSAAYGFASGDKNPHASRTCKTFKGFLGLHESYSGKRVSSLMFLDEMRGVLSIPGVLDANQETVDNNDLSFTNLHHFGFSTKWTPVVCNKKFTFHPNMLAYWRALPTKAFATTPVYTMDRDTNKPTTIQKVSPSGKPIFKYATTNNDASRFIGTEFNLKMKMELLKDLEIFGNFGMFLPGEMFSDIKGAPFKNSFGDTQFFDELSEEIEVEVTTLKQRYRLGTDIGYLANIGLSYAF